MITAVSVETVAMTTIVTFGKMNWGVSIRSIVQFNVWQKCLVLTKSLKIKSSKRGLKSPETVYNFLKWLKLTQLNYTVNRVN